MVQQDPPSLDDFVNMFAEEDARRMGRPVGNDILLNSREEVAAKAQALPPGLWEDEDGDVAHTFLEATEDLSEVPPSRLRPLEPPEEKPRKVPSAPSAPAPKAARRGRGFTAMHSRTDKDATDVQGVRSKLLEGDEKFTHDLDVLEGKARSTEAYGQPAPPAPSMEELLKQLDEGDGRDMREATDSVESFLSNFGPSAQGAAADAADKQRQQKAEVDLMNRLVGEGRRVEKGQGKDEDDTDLRERLARLRARQADDWEKEEVATLAAQSSQARFEEERRRARVVRRTGQGMEPPSSQLEVEGARKQAEQERLEQEKREEERRHAQEEARKQAEQERLELEKREEEQRRAEEEARKQAEQERLEQEKREEEEKQRHAEEEARKQAEQERLEQEKREEEQRQKREEEQRRAQEEEEARRQEEQERLEQEKRDDGRFGYEACSIFMCSRQNKQPAPRNNKRPSTVSSADEKGPSMEELLAMLDAEEQSAPAPAPPERRRRAGFSAMVMQSEPT
eukprot:symbB.v1.2.016654.t1/scaffold1274.1/size127343/9